MTSFTTNCPNSAKTEKEWAKVGNKCLLTFHWIYSRNIYTGGVLVQSHALFQTFSQRFDADLFVVQINHRMHWTQRNDSTPQLWTARTRGKKIKNTNRPTLTPRWKCKFHFAPEIDRTPFNLKSFSFFFFCDQKHHETHKMNVTLVSGCNHCPLNCQFVRQYLQIANPHHFFQMMKILKAKRRVIAVYRKNVRLNEERAWEHQLISSCNQYVYQFNTFSIHLMCLWLDVLVCGRIGCKLFKEHS